MFSFISVGFVFIVTCTSYCVLWLQSSSHVLWLCIDCSAFFRDMLQWMLLCMPFGRVMCVFIYFVNELVSYELCMLSFFPMTTSLHCLRITVKASAHLCWHLVILVEVYTSVMFGLLLYIFSARDWTRACSFEMIVNVYFLMSNNAELVFMCLFDYIHVHNCEKPWPRILPILTWDYSLLTVL